MTAVESAIIEAAALDGLAAGIGETGVRSYTLPNARACAYAK